MADKTIGSLPGAASIDDDSLLVMEQQGKAYSISGAKLRAYAATQYLPDLAENDETASGYVKNRTHWYEPSVSVLAATTIKNGMGMLLKPLGLVVGKQYVVSCDGKQYVCTAQTWSDGSSTGAGLGRGYGMSGLDDAGAIVSFTILDYSDSALVETGRITDVIVAVDTAAIIHKLDLMYLPIPTPTAADAGKVLRVKSDGSGYELAEV